MVTSRGEALEEAANKFSVVVAKRLKVTTFNGTVILSAKNSSTFTIKPPMESATSLKSWFDSVWETQLDDILQDHTIAISRDLVDNGMKKVHTVAEIEKETEYGDYWIRGFLNISDEDQKLFYIACNNCYSKIKVEEGTPYECFLCKKSVIGTPRPIVVMSISDHTASMKVVAIEAVAENIIQASASRIAGLVRLGQSYDLQPIKSEFSDKFFLMALRRTYGRKNESQRRLLLIAYYDETFNPSESQPQAHVLASNSSAKENRDNSSLSPLKRQMSQVTIHSETAPKRQLLMGSEENIEQLQYVKAIEDVNNSETAQKRELLMTSEENKGQLLSMQDNEYVSSSGSYSFHLKIRRNNCNPCHLLKMLSTLDMH